MDSIFSEIDSLSLYAGTHSKRLGYHRLIAKRFPYGIYYRLEGDVAVVYRILGRRRDPAWIQQQLK
jgi:plasmid stabilization system protein ParE